MAKINKHGLNINGLRAASGETVAWHGTTQIFYDLESGDIWTVDVSDNSRTVYHSDDVLHICDTSRHMTMQEIADEVRDAVSWHNKTYPAYAAEVESNARDLLW